MKPRDNEQNLQSKNHEDHVAGKGFTWMFHYNLVHKFIPMPQTVKVPDAKAAWDFGESQEQEGGHSGSTMR